MVAAPAEVALAGTLAAAMVVGREEVTEVAMMEEAREREGWEAEATVEETAEETATVEMAEAMAEVSGAAMEVAMAEYADHTWTRCTGGSAP